MSRYRLLRTLPTLALAAAAGAAVLLSSPPAAAVTGPAEENPQSTVRLVSPWQTAPASGELWLGLRFTVAPGWHVYWKNSGDAGFPPAVSFAPTPAVRRAELLFPAPERYELPGDLVAFGYEDEVIYPLRLEIDAAGQARLELVADLDYLVCEVDCVPYSYRLTLDQPLAGGGEPTADPATAEALAAWRRRLPVAAEAAAGATTRAVLDLGQPARPLLVVEVSGAAAAAAVAPELFLEADELFTAGRPQLERRGDDLVFRVPLAYREVPAEPPRQLDVAWTVTGLSAGDAALAVEARRTVYAATPAAPGAPPAAVALRRLPLALLGGLLAALSPSALPWLLALLLGLGGVAGTTGVATARRAAVAAAGGALAGALVLAVWALAAAAAGAAPVWGMQLQAPAALAVPAVLAVLAACNLWGLVGGPLPLTGGPTTATGGAAGRAFVAAALLAPLAMPWNLEPLAAALGPALAGGGVMVVAALAAAGAGLALPLAVAALFPRLFERFGTAARAREALGFAALAAALWLLYLLAPRVTKEALAFVELGLLALALAAWALRRAAGRPLARAVWATALLVLAALVVWLADDGSRAAAPEPTAVAAVEVG